ncbi:hypothetical protein PG993_001792 [Apiospora rasikravindrae]|uniref:Uncharacterized protein n=1 Tax=Apiospora rasikravindrae TaxID=990691 RepID=A0ABR1UCE9_9PEZI
MYKKGLLLAAAALFTWKGKEKAEKQPEREQANLSRRRARAYKPGQANIGHMRTGFKNPWFDTLADMSGNVIMGSYTRGYDDHATEVGRFHHEAQI